MGGLSLRSTIWLSAAILILCGGPVLLKTPSHAAETASQPSQALQSVAITMGTKTIHAKLADSNSARIEGLLRWNTITDETGMLLDFIHEGNYAIHMQGMKFPIVAVWMDSKGVVRLIYEDIQPDSGIVYPSMLPCRYCLELKSGFCKRYGVKIGQKLTFGASDSK